MEIIFYPGVQLLLKGAKRAGLELMLFTGLPEVISQPDRNCDVIEVPDRNVRANFLRAAAMPVRRSNH
ncbi:MAG TPA: hypothetical protein VKI61_15880 [Chitinophagaceae bacterium]|nr:hypothetical protein [Chitinophagaceae bacterium]